MLAKLLAMLKANDQPIRQREWRRLRREAVMRANRCRWETMHRLEGTHMAAGPIARAQGVGGAARAGARGIRSSGQGWGSPASVQMLLIYPPLGFGIAMRSPGSARQSRASQQPATRYSGSGSRADPVLRFRHAGVRESPHLPPSSCVPVESAWPSSSARNLPESPPPRPWQVLL